MQASLLVDKRLSCLDAACVVDALVNPVPDAAASDTVAALDDVPVFLEVAYSLTHSVSILTDEVRLAIESVAVLQHTLDLRIHV